MRFHASFLLALCASLLPVQAESRFSFHVIGGDPSGWQDLLSSMGLTAGTGGGASVIVAPHGTDLPAAEWQARVEHGVMLVVEGESPLAASLGFHAGKLPHMPVRSVEDLRAPDLRIVWEKSLDLPVFEIPTGARVFARERWQKAPLIAGYRKGEGAVLWVAAPPGPRGYERFPYLPQALLDLGLEPPFRSSRLWAFFDSAYRSRVDVDYFAERWRASGISALHVAAWHFWERDPESDEYLRHLIDACHRNAIQVYAWMELPHVSDAFWDKHPEWRKKRRCNKTPSWIGASL